ncbi:MAG: hypothetical protein QNJ67_06105 [Kiloniellales bacterium]|nr:hypothetical protein [Kiloniellales bacterium]
MKSFKIDCEITSVDRVDISNEQDFEPDDVVTSVAGLLHLRFGDTARTFETIRLLLFTTVAIQSSWELLTFAVPGSKKTVTIHEYTNVLCMRANKDVMELSLESGNTVMETAQCPVSTFLRNLGLVHKSLTKELLAKNPELMNTVLFRYIHPGAVHFAVHGLD